MPPGQSQPLLAASVRGYEIRLFLNGYIPPAGVQVLQAHFARCPPDGAGNKVYIEITGDGPWAVRHQRLCCLTADTIASLLATVEHVLHAALSSLDHPALKASA